MHKKANSLTDQLKAIGMFFFVLTVVSSPMLATVAQGTGRGPLAESTQVEETPAESSCPRISPTKRAVGVSAEV